MEIYSSMNLQTELAFIRQMLAIAESSNDKFIRDTSLDVARDRLNIVIMENKYPNEACHTVGSQLDEVG